MEVNIKMFPIFLFLYETLGWYRLIEPFLTFLLMCEMYEI